MSALGLTDHNLLTGTIEFVTACAEADIQPIIGLEIDLETGPLNLLATSLEGWSNLCRLSSALALRDHTNQPCSLDMISTYSKDLIALSSDPDLLFDIFPDRLYVSLNDPSQAISMILLLHVDLRCRQWLRILFIFWLQNNRPYRRPSRLYDSIKHLHPFQKILRTSRCLVHESPRSGKPFQGFSRCFGSHNGNRRTL